MEKLRKDRHYALVDAALEKVAVDPAARRMRVGKAVMRATESDLARVSGEDFAAIRVALGEGISAVGSCAEWIVERFGNDIKAAHAGAVPFLKLMGIVCGGWQMARAALVAQRKLDAGEGDAAFLRAKIATARFFGDHVLSQARGLAHAAMDGSAGVLALEEAAFG